MDFEKVDRHIQEADLTIFQDGGDHYLKAEDGICIDTIRQIYKIVRPILLIFNNFLFIPQKWRIALEIFIQAMDIVYPSSKNSL